MVSTMRPTRARRTQGSACRQAMSRHKHRQPPPTQRNATVNATTCYNTYFRTGSTRILSSHICTSTCTRAHVLRTPNKPPGEAGKRDSVVQPRAHVSHFSVGTTTSVPHLSPGPRFKQERQDRTQALVGRCARVYESWCSTHEDGVILHKSGTGHRFAVPRPSARRAGRVDATAFSFVGTRHQGWWRNSHDPAPSYFALYPYGARTRIHTCTYTCEPEEGSSPNQRQPVRLGPRPAD